MSTRQRFLSTDRPSSDRARARSALAAAGGLALVAVVAAPAGATAGASATGVADMAGTATTCLFEPFGPAGGVAGEMSTTPDVPERLIVLPPHSTSYFETFGDDAWEERQLDVDSDRELVRIVTDPFDPERTWATTDPGTTRDPGDTRGPDGLYVWSGEAGGWIPEQAPASGVHREILVHHSGRRVFTTETRSEFATDRFRVVDPDGTVHVVDLPHLGLGPTLTGGGVLVGDSAYFAIPDAVVVVDDITADVPVADLAVGFDEANGRIPLLAGDGNVLVAGLPDRSGDIADIRVSTDGGASWQRLDPENDEGEGLGLSMLAVIDGQILFGHAFGLGRSVDGGQSWEPWCDLPDGVWALDAAPYGLLGPGLSIAVEDHGLFEYIDG